MEYYDILKKYADAQELVALYDDKSDTECFMAGFIAGLSEDSILLATVYSTGRKGAIIAMHLDDFYRIEANSANCERLKKLYTIRGEKHAPIKQKTSDQISNLLDHAKEEGKVVIIVLANSNLDDVIGLVTRFDEHCVEVRQYDRGGKYDGDTFVLVDDITQVKCYGEMQYTIELLLQADNK